MNSAYENILEKQLKILKILKNLKISGKEK